MMAPCDAQARATSSRARTYPTVSPPLPPRASGIAMPMRPSSPMRRTVSRGKRASRSISAAIGRTSFSAKSRATCWIMRCSSVSSMFIYLLSAGPRHGPRTPPFSALARPVRARLAVTPRRFSWHAGRLPPPGPGRLFLQELLELLLEQRGHLEEVAHDAVVRDLEDRRLGILVDGADHLGCPHSRQLLDGPRDAEAQVELRRDRAARLADLEAMRPPPGIHRRARRSHRRPDHLGK